MGILKNVKKFFQKNKGLTQKEEKQNQNKLLKFYRKYVWIKGW